MRENRALHTRELLALAGEVHVLARKHGECDRSDGDSYDLRVVSSAR